MAKYLISFPSSAMNLANEALDTAGREARAVIEAAKKSGGFVFAGGIDESFGTLLVSADATISQGGYPDSRPLNGGFAVLEVASRDDAILWAARLAKACRCQQELRVFGFDPAS